MPLSQAFFFFSEKLLHEKTKLQTTKRTIFPPHGLTGLEIILRYAHIIFSTLFFLNFPN